MSNGILIADDNASIRNLLRMLVETSTPFKVCGEARFFRGCVFGMVETVP
jgi:hypothetical protein